MKLFMDACEISGALQIGVRGPVAGENGVRLLHQPFAVFGRDHRSDVPLDHGLVSRRHLYLQVVRGRAFWIDLDSRSGTLCQGEAQRSGWLDAGKHIQIGPFEIERLGGSEEVPELARQSSAPWATPFVARQFEDQSLPEVELEFLNGPSRFARWPMNRVMSLIGSSSGCKFRLADPSVSSFHCNLLRTHLGLWIVDLLGSSGIVVNDASVRYAQLNDNDVLGVGRYRIRIRCRFADPVPNDQGSMCSRQPPVVIPRCASPGTQNYRVSMTNPETVNSSTVPARHLQASVSELMSLFHAPQQSPSFQWISTGGNELAGIEKPEVNETLLIPLMNQFGHMQQQMLEQFQQAIAMLVEMFGTLHRDQMQTIREELDQIRDLTKEFQALKVELAARTEGRPEAASTQFGISGVPGEDAAEASRVKLQTDSTSSSQVSRASVNDPASSREASPRTNCDAPASPSGAPETPQLDQRQTANPQAAACKPEASPDLDRDVVFWLHQRMMTLQKERETRWQRILKLLPGFS